VGLLVPLCPFPIFLEGRNSGSGDERSALPSSESGICIPALPCLLAVWRYFGRTFQNPVSPLPFNDVSEVLSNLNLLYMRVRLLCGNYRCGNILFYLAKRDSCNTSSTIHQTPPASQNRNSSWPSVWLAPNWPKLVVSGRSWVSERLDSGTLTQTLGKAGWKETP